MKRCRTCLYPDSKPDLFFDETGQCSACTAFEKRKSINWEERQQQLLTILEQAKYVNGYNCIVASSGGKDSTWITLKLLELGAKPLCVTATTCHLTKVGRMNLDNLAKYATTIEVSPNKTVRAALNRLGMELVGDISWPEHVSIFTAPFNMAVKLGIPLIFYGECPQEAYGGPIGTDEVKIMTRRWVSEFGGFLGLRPSDMIGSGSVQYGPLITHADMEDYYPPSDEAVETLGVTAYWLGQFYDWNSHRNAALAIDRGFLGHTLPCYANWWVHENLDNAQTGLHDYMMFKKYGYGRFCAQISVDIRRGMISREQALPLCEKYDGLFPETYAGVSIQEVLERIEMPREELDRIIKKYDSGHFSGHGPSG